MKTFKRIASAVSALAILSAVTTTSVSAFAESEENSYEIIASSEYDVLTGETITVDELGIAPQAASPKIVCDIVYDSSAAANRKYRVDVKFSGMPKIYDAAFHVNVGSGWTISTNSNGGVIRQFSDNVNDNAGVTIQSRIGNLLFFTFSGAPNAADYNGTVVSFYLTKKSGNNSSNSGINVELQEGDHFTNGFDNEGKPTYLASVLTPVMLQANQYIIGDANGDGYVNAMDASTILSVTKKTPSLNVYSIRKTYKNYFPKAASPSAPDADRSGVINSTDAEKIVDYYAAVGSGKPYTGSIGKIDVYEIFN